MTRFPSFILRLCGIAMSAIATSAHGQMAPIAPPAVAAPALFAGEALLTVTFTANLKVLRADKMAEPPWRAATLQYAAPDGAPVVVAARARTRGIWRLKNCEFPPVRLNFGNQATKGTVFQGLDKPKLVNYCKDNEVMEEYILQEFQLYRVYRVLTESSHRVRLLRMSYADSATARVLSTRYAFLIEDPDSLAARLGGKILEAQNAGPGDLDPYFDALVGVFQYMIGNTDVSVAKLHNLELVQRTNGAVLPVAYDFDFAGAVNARYATVDPVLPIAQVRDRFFQGYCVAPSMYADVFKLFNEKKGAIYALYSDDLGKLLKPRTVTETLKYFDVFYKTINDPRQAKREIVDVCVKKG